MKRSTLIPVVLLFVFLIPHALGAVAKCEVVKFPMEKQVFQVFRGGKRISQPDFACSGQPSISPSGKLIAFTRCERDYHRLGDEDRLYSLVIFECDTTRERAFLGVPKERDEQVSVKAWAGDESGVLLSRPGPISAPNDFFFKFDSSL